MAKPPNFTGHSHRQMQRLLKAEDDRLQGRADFWLSCKLYAGAAFVLFVLGVVVYSFYGILG